MFITARAALVAAVLSLGWGAASAYVGQWHTFVHQDIITQFLPFEGKVFAATTGGVRRIDPVDFTETSYDNLNGLLDVSITGMAVAGGHLWAVSQNGFVQEWDGHAFTPYGRGYAAERWTMNPRAALGVGKYLVLGSEKGLSFFDTDKKLALVSLARIGSLSSPSVISLVNQGDTLFIGTVQGIFKAALDWNNLLSDRVSIYDPTIWSQVVAPGKGDSIPGLDTLPDRKFQYLTFLDGKLRYFKRGTVLTAPHKVEVFAGKIPLIDGDTLQEADTLYTEAAESNGALFLGGPFGIIASRKLEGGGKFMRPIRSPRQVPRDSIVNIVSRGGRAFVQSAYGLYLRNEDKLQPVPGYALPYSPDIAYWHLKNLTADAAGTAYIGTWGFGVARIQNGKQNLWNNSTDPCMDTILTRFDVINSISDVSGNSIWAATLKKDDAGKYQIVHIDPSRDKVTCLGDWGQSVATHAIKNISPTVIGVASLAGIDLFKHAEGGPADFDIWKKLKTSGQANESWDLAADAYDRVWTVLGDQLGYADSITASKEDSRPITLLDDFDGKECRYMESDADLNLWVGCSNGLFLVTPAATLEATRVDRFSLDDGLLSNGIGDISIDPDNGQVWLATDRGVSMYEGKVKAVTAAPGEFKVYPNPFRPQHRYVIFDNLPQGASVAVLTQSGSVVRRFAPSQVQGNQCQWDGLNAGGAKVSPGIYLYSVTSGAKTRMGKIIVAR
jgi:hypothetical protein